MLIILLFLLLLVLVLMDHKKLNVKVSKFKSHETFKCRVNSRAKFLYVNENDVFEMVNYWSDYWVLVGFNL